MMQEATIEDMAIGEEADPATARATVDWHRERIAAYEPLNAFVTVSDRASVDAAVCKPGLPLSGIPIAVKDNMQVAGLPMTCGSLALRDFWPASDCEVVRRLKAAGAVVLGKTSMSDFAWGISDTVGSAFGMTRNPYDIRHACGGSSGGSAVAVSANLAAAGLGTDTGCSIRAPASMTALVGVRPTLGLASMQGILPMSRFMDTVGPLARTAVDAAKVLKALAHERVEDPWSGETLTWDFSIAAVEHAPPSGYRLADIRSLSPESDTDPDVLNVYRSFLETIQANTVADVVPLFSNSWPRLDLRPWYRLFRHDVDAFLKKARPGHAGNTMADIVGGDGAHPLNRKVLADWAAIQDTPSTDTYASLRQEMRGTLRAAILADMDRYHLDALVFPTFRAPPPRNGDRRALVGSNNAVASIAGFPAVSMPIGFTNAGLPLGAQLLGRPWSEERLLQIVRAVEVKQSYRRAPPEPPIADRGS